MSIDPLSDEKVLHSWNVNALPWTSAVREERIQSRKLVTNAAIIDAVLSRAPKSVLDVGCGEGWLCRALNENGIETLGVDAIPALITRAKELGGNFQVASYEDIAAGHLKGRFDLVVSNFALIGKESVDNLVAKIPELLNPGGSFVVQTMHPVIAGGDEPYVDGWRPGTWTGFSSDFSDPAPWYFRTIETWVKLFRDSGWKGVEIREPLHPETGKPASIVFLAKVQGV